VLIAAVMAIGDAAPTPTENRIIGPTTVTTVKLPIAATTKNGDAPARAIADSGGSRPRNESSRLALTSFAGHI
jgi:hypothetical protein